MRTKLASYKQLSLMRSPSILASICLFSFLLLDLSILLLCAFIKCKFVSQLSMWINFLFVSKRIDFDEQLSLLDPELCWYKSILSFQYMDIRKKVIWFSVVFFSQNKKELIQIKGSLNLTLTNSRETAEIWEEMKHFFICLCAAFWSAISEVRARKIQKFPNYCFRDKKTWS